MVKVKFKRKDHIIAWFANILIRMWGSIHFFNHLNETVHINGHTIHDCRKYTRFSTAASFHYVVPVLSVMLLSCCHSCAFFFFMSSFLSVSFGQRLDSIRHVCLSKPGVIPGFAGSLPSPKIGWLTVCTSVKIIIRRPNQQLGLVPSTLSPGEVCCYSAPTAQQQLMDTQAFTWKNPCWALHSKAERSGIKMVSLYMVHFLTCDFSISRMH